jgi:hypothetical protein
VTLAAVPVTLREANAYIARYHRHHGPTRGMKFAIGCVASSIGELVGVVVVG